MGTVAGVGINDLKRGTYDRKAYIKWKSILERTYVQNKPGGHAQSYVGCSVSNEWLTFSNFYSWYQCNYREGYHLDKDILKVGNKVYGEDTCVFIPLEINHLVKERDYGVWPLGVDKQTRGTNEMSRPYRARATGINKTIHIGYFETPELAHKAWQECKSEIFQNALNWYCSLEEFNTHVAEALLKKSWDILTESKLGKQTKRT